MALFVASAGIDPFIHHFHLVEVVDFDHVVFIVLINRDLPPGQMKSLDDLHDHGYSVDDLVVVVVDFYCGLVALAFFQDSVVPTHNRNLNRIIDIQFTFLGPKFECFEAFQAEVDSLLSSILDHKMLLKLYFRGLVAKIDSFDHNFFAGILFDLHINK